MKNQKEKQTKTNNQKGSTFNQVTFLVYTILSVLIGYQIIKMGTLPTKYNLILVGILVLLALIIYTTLIFSKRRKLNVLSRIITIVLALLLLVGNYNFYKFGSLLHRSTGSETKTDTISVIVKKDSTYSNISEVKDLIFGIEDHREAIVLEGIVSIEEKVKQTIQVKEIDSYIKVVEALYADDVEVIIINEAYRNIITDFNPTFNEDTKVIYTYDKHTVIEKGDLDVTKDVFSVMISGIDIYGSISNNSRSDVNILATVNPNTKQIVLVSIPRDYYLPLACQNDAMDKLTHTGIYGVDCTMATVGNLFDVDIDYYARVNFSSLINVINAVGGVTVQNDHYFEAGGYVFNQGDVQLDGEKALVFVRDRYHQTDGDSARGRNQVKVLTAIINKMLSPTLITNFNSILGSLEGSFETNLTSNDINNLVKMQIEDMSSWEIMQEQVGGTGTSAYSFALGGNYYMMIPDMATVDRVKEVIESIK
ncbi:MAG: LCP family protein [Erysipelothrix sp.]|nr:LCP family protein [Erysipelothrix sp.]